MHLFKIAIILGIAAVVSSNAHGQEFVKSTELRNSSEIKLEKPHSGFDSKLWRTSIVTYAAANVLDFSSGVRLSQNPGFRETNPLMQSNAASLAIKGGIFGAVFVTEWIVLRHQPKAARALSFLNFGCAALPVWAASHNMMLK